MFCCFCCAKPKYIEIPETRWDYQILRSCPPTLPHKKGPGKVAVLKKIVILDFSKGVFFSLPNLKWFAEQRKQSLASLLYWEFESVEKLFDFEGGHFRL